MLNSVTMIPAPLAMSHAEPRGGREEEVSADTQVQVFVESEAQGEVRGRLQPQIGAFVEEEPVGAEVRPERRARTEKLTDGFVDLHTRAMLRGKGGERDRFSRDERDFLPVRVEAFFALFDNDFCAGRHPRAMATTPAHP